MFVLVASHGVSLHGKVIKGPLAEKLPRLLQQQERKDRQRR